LFASEEQNLIGLFMGKAYALPPKAYFANILAGKYRAAEEEAEQNIA
jgi:hypothetical protein